MSLTIFGAVDNCRWPSILYWHHSIRQAAPLADIQLIAYRMDKPTADACRDHGITIHWRELAGRHVVVARFRDLPDILEGVEPDWTIFADVTDLVFQSNPESWLAANLPAQNKELVVQSEAIRYKDQSFDRLNMQECFPEHWGAMKNELVANAGLIAGRPGAIGALSQDIFRLCRHRRVCWSNPDMAAMNVLLRQPEYHDRTLIANQAAGWCYCSAIYMSHPDERRKLLEPPAVLVDGLCLNTNGQPFSVLHHYTRDNAWRLAVESRIGKAIGL